MTEILAFIVLAAAILYLQWRLDKVMAVLSWVLNNVHIVPNNTKGDEALRRVARSLNITIEEKDGEDIG